MLLQKLPRLLEWGLGQDLSLHSMACEGRALQADAVA